MRLENIILQNRAYAEGAPAPMIDLGRSSQFGYAADYEGWVGNAAHIRNNVIVVLLEAPRAFQYLRDKEYWYGTLRELLEGHAQTVDGLNGGLEVETIGNPIGAGGQQQREFTKVREIESSATFKWIEKYGMPVGKFWRRYITMLMADPLSNVPGIANLPGVEIPDLLPDMYSFSAAFIQPDRLHRKVDQAWIGTNLFPQRTGDLLGNRDIANAREGTSIDINMGGIYQYGPGVDIVAQRMLNEINITGAMPADRRGFIQAVQGVVASTNNGYKRSAERVGEQQQTL